jgi:site-specific recombinase XerD
VSAAAEIEGVRLHDIRHTVASYALHDGGLSQREVMELLGHSQMSTTERYLNVHDERQRSISDRASRAIFSAKD